MRHGTARHVPCRAVSACLCRAVPENFPSLVKIILFTPNHVPMAKTNDEFSLIENSVIMNCISCSKEDKETKSSSKTPPKPDVSYLKLVFGSSKGTFMYVLVLVGHIAMVIRRQAFTSWLGSGWPEWVAQETDPKEFNEQINEFQSILAIAFFPVNIIPGLMIGES